jgi:hypothetical protein
VNGWFERYHSWHEARPARATAIPLVTFALLAYGAMTLLGLKPETTWADRLLATGLIVVVPTAGAILGARSRGRRSRSSASRAPHAP